MIYSAQISLESLKIGPDIFGKLKNRPRYLWKVEESAQISLESLKVGPDIFGKFENRSIFL